MSLYCSLLSFIFISISVHAGFEVNTQSREEVRNFYNAIFQASENVPAQWTGSTNSCNAGTVSQAYQDATLLRKLF